MEDDTIIIEVKTSIISFKNHIKLGEEYTVSHLGRKAKVRQNILRSYHECEGGIEKSVPRITASPSDAKQ